MDSLALTYRLQPNVGFGAPGSLRGYDVTRGRFACLGTVGIPTGLAWGDSAIIFPRGEVPPRWRCALTGRTVETQNIQGGAALLAREVFLTLPVALLIGE